MVRILFDAELPTELRYDFKTVGGVDNDVLK